MMSEFRVASGNDDALRALHHRANQLHHQGAGDPQLGAQILQADKVLPG